MRRVIALAVVLLLMVFAGLGCGGSPNYQAPPSGTGTGGGGGPSTTGTGNAITISNFTFSPGTTTVKVGTKVTWTNKDSVGHQVYSDDGTIKGPVINPGSTFSWTFTKAGNMPYHCNIHKYMTATIVVR